MHREIDPAKLPAAFLQADREETLYRACHVSAEEKEALCKPLVVNVPSAKLTEHELMATRIRALIEDFTAIGGHYDGGIWNVVDHLEDAATEWKATYPLTAEDKAELYHDAREGE